jgi:predicted nucleic acid-binding protein
MSYIVDASAAFEYLLQTPLGIRVGALIGASDVHAPSLFDAEVLSVIRRLTLRKQIPENRANEAVADLALWQIDRLPDHALLQVAWRHYRNVSAYDALYVAAAQILAVPLLTVDGPLSRVPVPGLTILNVRETA